MKNYLFYYLIFLLLLAVSCEKEKGQAASTVDEAWRDVPVCVGGQSFSNAPDTRSTCSIAVEDFNVAYLFAFEKNQNVILSNGQGNIAALKTETVTFQYPLPPSKSVDIYVVVNPGEYESVFEAALGNASLTRGDLEGLIFTCNSNSAFFALEDEGYGMPMTAIKRDVSTSSNSISISVEHLFAKYDILVNTSAFASNGYTIHSSYLKACRSNKAVPFFYEGGYKQDVSSNLGVIDVATDDDIINLNAEDPVTLYFLENCQGTKSGASSWRTVEKDLGSAVDMCSYVELGVEAIKDGITNRFSYRVFLGSGDMKSDFNVRRNYYKTVSLVLSPFIQPQVEFKWTNTEDLSVAPGNTISIPFVCNGMDPSFFSSDANYFYYTGRTYYGSTTYNGVTYSDSGIANYIAANNASSGYRAKGGTLDVYAEVPVSITPPTQSFTIHPCCIWWPNSDNMVDYEYALMVYLAFESDRPVDSPVTIIVQDRYYPQYKMTFVIPAGSCFSDTELLWDGFDVGGAGYWGWEHIADLYELDHFTPESVMSNGSLYSIYIPTNWFVQSSWRLYEDYSDWESIQD